MVQMEKFQMHQVLQGLLDRKDPQEQLDLRDQPVQQARQVQVEEHQDQQEQLVHQVLREALDQRDQQVLPAQQVRLVQLDLLAHKVRLEQLEQLEHLECQKLFMDQ
jgi:hypothetical protein